MQAVIDLLFGPEAIAFYLAVVAFVAGHFNHKYDVILGLVTSALNGFKKPPAAMLLLAAFVLMGGNAKADEKTSNLMAKQGADVAEVAFSHDGGKVKFLRIVALETVYDDAKKPTAKRTRVIAPANPLFGDAIELTVNGRRVDDAALETWVSRTVDIRARFTEWGFEFFGGKPAAASCICGDSCSCAAGSCPAKCPVQSGGCANGQCQPRVIWSSGPGVLGTQPQTFGPIQFPPQFGGCPNGRCQNASPFQR